MGRIPTRGKGGNRRRREKRSGCRWAHSSLDFGGAGGKGWNKKRTGQKSKKGALWGGKKRLGLTEVAQAQANNPSPSQHPPTLIVTTKNGVKGGDHEKKEEETSETSKGMEKKRERGKPSDAHGGNHLDKTDIEGFQKGGRKALKGGCGETSNRHQHV